MYADISLLSARCIQTCPDTTPSCNCAENETCTILSRGCDTCPVAQCIAQPPSGSAGGISKGAVAGAVIGALVVLGLAIGAFFWYRRRSQRISEPEAVKPDVPANAETVLSRPDPNEKSAAHTFPAQATPKPVQDPSAIRLYPIVSNSTINLDPSQPVSYRASVQSDPFTDVHSIQTASDSTQSTNVIPIALVPHGSVSSPSADASAHSSTTQSTGPARPPRSPNLNIRLGNGSAESYNLEHATVSSDSLRTPRLPYTSHTHGDSVSRLSAVSSRLSYMTTGSNASSILAEAPQIVTPVSGGVRQVLGVAKAAVVKAPTTPGYVRNTNPTGGLAPRLSKVAPRSPLAQNSYGPEDVVPQAQSSDPFADESASALPSSASTRTFGWQYEDQSSHYPEMDDRGRPLSELTQAGSIIGAITSATRVQIVSPLSSPGNASRRMTHGRLITTPSTSSLRAVEDTLQAQQERALAVARAKAVASGLSVRSSTDDYNGSRRQSVSTVASAGGDSLLESFTFVPPSPISSRPIRSPPRSPLGHAVFGQNASNAVAEAQLRLQTHRQQQGLSTASGASALDGYTFHIQPSSFSATAVSTPMPSSAGFSEHGHHVARNAQRASLDTLALTNDLSAFPLNFDDGSRDAFAVRR